MRGVRLFIRTRRWRLNAVVFLVTAALVIVCGPLAIGLTPNGGGLTRVAMMLPLIPATLVAASLQSPLPLQEAAAARDLGQWRLLHVVALSAALLAALVISGAFLPAAGADTHDQGLLSLCRNAVALVGAALIGYRLLGVRLGWILAITWVILPPQIIPRPENDPVGLVTLITQPDSSAGAFTWAVLTWSVGLLSASTMSWRR